MIYDMMKKRHPLYNKVYLYFLEKAYKSKTKIKANKCLQAFSPLPKDKLSKYDRDDFFRPLKF